MIRLGPISSNFHYINHHQNQGLAVACHGYKPSTRVCNGDIIFVKGPMNFSRFSQPKRPNECGFLSILVNQIGPFLIFLGLVFGIFGPAPHHRVLALFAALSSPSLRFCNFRSSTVPIVVWAWSTVTCTSARHNLWQCRNLAGYSCFLSPEN